MEKSLFIDLGNGIIRNPELSDEEVALIQEQMKSDNIDKLWNAAHDYEYAQINGMAIGMLVLGVLQKKPKSIAVQAWIQWIWNLYYIRKPFISHEDPSEYLDFSCCGKIPFTIPELMAELEL